MLLLLFRYWRLNVSLLINAAATQDLKQQPPNPNPKTIIRGKMIPIASRLDKIRLEEQMKLENKIKQLESEHKTTRTHNTLLELKENRKALDRLLTYKTEGALRFYKQKYYELGNRASRFLAFQLRKSQASCVVPKIVHPTLQKTVSHPKEIADAFAIFYKELYEETRSKTKKDNSEAFLSNLHLPSLSEDEALQMISDITETEVRDAIKKLKKLQISRDRWTPWRVL